MAALTGAPEPDILSRLETLLGDAPEDAATPEDAPETKPPEIRIPPQDVTQPKVELSKPSESDEVAEEVAADAVAEEETTEAEAAAEDETSAEDAAEEEGINTVSDLAKMFEVKESELLDHLQVDSGNGESISLSRVIETYKNAPDAVRRWDELQGEQATFRQEAQNLRTTTDAHVRELAVHAQVLLDMTNEEFANVDWERLKLEDSTQYLLLKEKQKERATAIGTAIEKLRAVDQQRTQEPAPGARLNRDTELRSLRTAMPEWNDQDVAKAAMDEVNTYLAEDRGFSIEEINGLMDHRYLLVAYDAARYRNLKKQAPEKLKGLRGLPKPKAVLRSTARRDPRADAQKQSQKNFDRLKETGTEEDAARVLEDLL